MKKLWLFCFWLALMGHFVQISPQLKYTNDFAVTDAHQEEDIAGKFEIEKKKMEDKTFFLATFCIQIPDRKQSLCFLPYFYQDISLTPPLLPPNV